MRIATVGTGGIGGFLAAKLTISGHQVAAIARGPHLDAIKANGLTLVSPAGQETVQPWIVTDDTANVGKVDAIIFGVKGEALKAAAHSCLPMLGQDTAVVPFLNGVEAADRLMEVLPGENVANGLAKISTTIAAPGTIKQTGDFSVFVFGERDNRPSRRIEALREAIQQSGSMTPVPENIDREVWTKFVFFSALSGVTAAARCTMAEVIRMPELSSLFQRVVAETAAVGRAAGISLDMGVEEKTWAFAQTLPEEMRASTAIDLEVGRPLEIDWVTGAVCRLAAKHGVATPANDAIYALLLPFRDGPKI